MMLTIYMAPDVTKYCVIIICATDAIPTLSWWWGLSAPEMLTATPAVV
jgi:hypothetical protein